MQFEKYEITQSSNHESYDFFSDGPKGKIKKVIQFTKFPNTSIYNLGFGDAIIETGEIDDLVISDNKDSRKILATVAFTVVLFLEKHPDIIIFATGSTPTRTRLYQIGIANIYHEINKEYVIMGVFGDENEPFKKNKVYDSFFVYKKSTKFEL